jgi:hypothetical protein
MGSTAIFRQFGPFFTAGALVGSPRLYHYIAGTSTLKDAWTDRAKTTTAAQPLVGDANGILSAYFDGLYKLVVKDSADVLLYTWDNVDLTEDEHRLEGSTTWDPTAMLPGQGQTSPGITVTGAAFGDYVDLAAPYALQGIIAQAAVSASNTVTIRLDRPLATLSGSATWNPGTLRPGQGELSPSITVTGAVLGDAVVVYPPYDVQGILVDGQVSATDTVKIQLYRDTAMLRGSATFDPTNLVDGAGTTSAGITVTGAVVGDTVLVYPPYDLQDITVTGYVQAANTVEVRVQNEGAATVDLASGTWEVAVIPRSSDIDLASGTWQVAVLPKGSAIDLASGTWKVRVRAQ